VWYGRPCNETFLPSKLLQSSLDNREGA
jgi:hypothetical protein